MAAYTAAEIVELALRKTGVLSTLEEQADSDAFAVGLQFFDLLIDHITGTKKFPWMQPVTNQIITLNSGGAATNEYDLNGLLSERINFVYGVYLYWNGEYQRELKIIRKNEFDTENKPYRSGNPETVYISSGDRPKMCVLPGPVIEGFSIQIKGQSIPANIRAEDGKINHDFPNAWQLYLVTKLAAEIGDGPVVTLDGAKLNRLIATAKMMESELMGSRSAHEQRKLNRVVKPRVF